MLKVDFFTESNPDLPPSLSQHQCRTSLTLLWLNGGKSLKPGSGREPETRRQGRLLQQEINLGFWKEMFQRS